MGWLRWLLTFGEALLFFRLRFQLRFRLWSFLCMGVCFGLHLLSSDTSFLCSFYLGFLRWRKRCHSDWLLRPSASVRPFPRCFGEWGSSFGSGLGCCSRSRTSLSKANGKSCQLCHQIQNIVSGIGSTTLGWYRYSVIVFRGRGSSLSTAKPSQSLRILWWLEDLKLSFRGCPRGKFSSYWLIRKACFGAENRSSACERCRKLLLLQLFALLREWLAWANYCFVVLILYFHCEEGIQMCDSLHDYALGWKTFNSSLLTSQVAPVRVLEDPSRAELSQCHAQMFTADASVSAVRGLWSPAGFECRCALRFVSNLCQKDESLKSY